MEWERRVALEAGWLLSDAFAEGVWLCELAPVSERADVVFAVAQVLRVRPQDGMSLIDGVIDALRGRRLLLIIDNCEHVLHGVVELVTRVAVTCPTVAILSTSRESLRVQGEHTYSVAGLSAAT